MKEESIKRGAEAAGAREGVMWYRMLAISGGSAGGSRVPRPTTVTGPLESRGPFQCITSSIVANLRIQCRQKGTRWPSRVLPSAP